MTVAVDTGAAGVTYRLECNNTVQNDSTLKVCVYELNNGQRILISCDNWNPLGPTSFDATIGPNQKLELCDGESASSDSLGAKRDYDIV
ncbi:MAG: hypothetical protein AB7I19_07725 [Planctomycetota bacterium]